MPGLTARKPDGMAVNAAPRFDWINLPRSGNPADPPPMPGGDARHHMETIRWWRDHWSLPQSLLWNPKDPQHRTLCMIHDELNQIEDDYERSLPPSLINNKIKIENDLGLNPRAMLTMFWRIVPDEYADDVFMARADRGDDLGDIAKHGTKTATVTDIKKRREDLR